MTHADPTAQPETSFSSTLPVLVLTRPAGSPDPDWQVFDQGPGFFNIPADLEIRVRVKSINDDELATLVAELEPVHMLRFLDLSENRNITNQGLLRLKALPQLTGLNLSSVSVTSTGLDALRALPRLTHLNLSYCNRLTDLALKTLEAMRGLEFVDLKGCPAITKGGLARMRHKNLEIHR